MARLGSGSRAIDVLLSEFLCVAENERVVITADTNTDIRLVQALLDGALCRARQASVVLMPRLLYQGGLADPHIPDACSNAITAADVWIDVTFPYLAGSGPHDAVMHAGATRYLLLGDPDLAAFTRLFGDPDFERYFDAQEAFDKVFACQGARGRITCPLGTDFTFEISKPIFAKPRRATKPGMYTVPGAASIGADIKTIKGRIVLSSVFHKFYEVLHQPVEIEVDGAIKSIKGASSAALAFQTAVKRAAGKGESAIIHMTNGLHPTARFTGGSFVEDMRAFGNNAIGFGLPWWEPGGGENHPDGVLIGQTVWIENDIIVEHGRVVGGGDELVQKAQALML